ncbi:DUF4136 domain-containing protein [Xanthomarina sp. F2636L]|uniref:DUF4136 domain-containing protein n=1 Tax=Xanthomarina sp. F2636L TaxID=2996018 RepID=UPI00225DF194|nr:DUF4136 domain-containing protein [Xanthomarina sp. F2636L]MCX7550735.1 DUF4136 domain-containing protein [Xanthomarina sp. F2636L]
MKKLASIFFLFLCLSCGVTVNYDYEKNTDFTKYKSYSYFSNMDTGLSELDAKRLFKILDNTMSLKGFTLSEDSDFIINIESSTYQENRSNSSVGVGVGGGGGNVGGGISVGIPLGQANMSRQIKFDFVDAKTNQLFWQAITSETDVSRDYPEEREEKFQQIVTKALDGFPPKK